MRPSDCGAAHSSRIGSKNLSQHYRGCPVQPANHSAANRSRKGSLPRHPARVDVSAIVEHTPWLVAMGLLSSSPAFCSASEAALFFLDRRDRRQLAAGNRAQRVSGGPLGRHRPLAHRRPLLEPAGKHRDLHDLIDPHAPPATRRLSRAGGRARGRVAGGVRSSWRDAPRRAWGWRSRGQWPRLVSLPLATLVRLADPLLPILRGASVLSRRVLWPGFKEEPYLAVGDLERRGASFDLQ